jgi:serine phosphatase RsbU (regulator of sigma subunit)
MQNQDQQELPTTLEQALHQLSVERAASRIREEVLVMRSADDLRTVVTTFFQEIIGLGVETVQCNLSFFDEEAGLVRSYTAMEDPGKYGISWMPPSGEKLAPGVVGGYLEESLDKWPPLVLEEWHAGKAMFESRIAEENEFVMDLRAENPDLERYPPFTGEWITHNVPFTHGIVGFAEKEHREEHTAIVQALAEALSLGYLRFLDFHAIEAARQKLIDELEEELQTAHDMQMRLMPVESPQIPNLDIAGRCLTANHVGGDFFQYYPQDDKLTLCMADVTGHAMEAAIPVVMFSGILESQIELAEDLDALFARLNRTLCKTLDDRTFVCFAMADLDLASRRLNLANGGCPYPYHYRAATGDIAEIQVEAYPLGIRPDTAYPSIEIHLEPGDRLVLCSDGIVEAADAEDQLFGFERIAATIRQGCADDLSSEDLLQYLLAAVEKFTGDVPRADDQTVVVLTVQK